MGPWERVGQVGRVGLVGRAGSDISQTISPTETQHSRSLLGMATSGVCRAQANRHRFRLPAHKR